MEAYTVLCALIVFSTVRGALNCQGRDVEEISRVLADVPDWKGLAGWLNIKSDVIETNCARDVAPASCFRRELVRRYCDSQVSENPSKVAEDIARVLEQMERKLQAQRLRKLKLGAPKPPSSDTESACEADPQDRGCGTMERERNKLTTASETTPPRKPLHMQDTESASEAGLQGSYQGKEKPNMLHIILIKYTINNKQEEFRLVERIQHKWHDIGSLLGVPVNAIDSHKTNAEKCQDVLRVWMEKGSEQYPVEWDGLIKVLQDVQLKEVAKDLRKALDNKLQ